MAKRLYRSRSNRIVLGILGGLGEYWGMDPSLLRLGFVLVMFVTGIVPLLLAYFVAYFVVPPRPDASQGRGREEEA